MSTSFNTLGATPKGTGLTNSFGGMASGTTPQSKALNNRVSPASSGLNNSIGQSRPNIPAAAPAPTNQPIKKQTVTTAGGDTHTTEYHAPEQTNKTSSPTSNSQTVQGGILSVPGYGGANGTPSDTSNGTYQTPSGATVNAQGGLITPAQQPNQTHSGLITSAVNSAQGNAGIGQNAANIAADFAKRYTEVGQLGAKAQGGYLSTGTTPVAEGNAAIIANTTANQQKAIAEGETAALQGTGQQLTAQNQQTTGLLGAGGLTAPVMQAGMLTNPQNGQPLNPSLVANAVQQATQLVQNGANVNDPQVQALLNPFGYYGASAFTEAQQALSGGTYNPSSQSAIVEQNLAQGQEYQKQAQDIGNSLQLLGTIAPQLTDFMTRANQNPALTPLINTQISKINAQTNPEAYTTMKAVMGETRSFVQQMLQATGGMTPTDAGEIADSYDFSQMTPQNLSDFLDNMELVGNYRLSQAQSASQTGYGAGSNPAQGPDANTSGSLKTSATGAFDKLPPQFKFILGAGSGLVGSALDAVKGAAGSAAGAAAGATAATVLGI